MTRTSSAISRAGGATASASSSWRARTSRPPQARRRRRRRSPPASSSILGEDYNTAINIYSAPEMAGGAVSERPDRDALIARYRERRSGAIYFDDLLTPRALATLQRYLRESTIWHDFSHIGGFVASYLEDGLACPLLLQIADELRAHVSGAARPASADPGLGVQGARSGGGGRRARRRCRGQRQFLGHARRRQPGAGSRRAAGLPHAAACRLGAQVYDADQARIVTFLEQQADNTLLVPYRENRAVLFESRLFHYSDAPNFDKSYENHRINLTMLFGRHGRTGAPRPAPERWKTHHPKIDTPARLSTI